MGEREWDWEGVGMGLLKSKEEEWFSVRDWTQKDGRAELNRITAEMSRGEEAARAAL